MPGPVWVGPEWRIVLNEIPPPGSSGTPVGPSPVSADSPIVDPSKLAESKPAGAPESSPGAQPSTPPASDFRFPKRLRLRKGAEFQAVFSHKVSVSDKTLVLYLKANGLGHHRIGLCISKKVTKNAPNRTLWKRMLREAFRLDHHSWPGGYDFVVLSRTIRPPGLEALREILSRLVRRGMTRPQQGLRPPKGKDRKPVNGLPATPAPGTGGSGNPSSTVPPAGNG